MLFHCEHVIMNIDANRLIFGMILFWGADATCFNILSFSRPVDTFSRLQLMMQLAQWKKENKCMMAIDGPWVKWQNVQKSFLYLYKKKNIIHDQKENIFFHYKTRNEIDETKFTVSLSTANCWFSIECLINRCN